MDLISVGIIGLVFILLVVFTVLTKDSWHWINIVFVNLTFLAGVGAAIGLSQALHLRYEAMKELEDARTSKITNEKEANLLVYGNPDSSTYDRQSLRGKIQETDLVMTGRGRVWSGGKITADAENRVFQFAAPRPADEAAQVKLKDVLLYVFSDSIVQLNEGKVLPYPQSYIGSVMVAEESADKVTLKPVFIASGQEWSQPSTTWSLFEKMPLDRHDTFQMAIVAFVDSNPDKAPEPYKRLAENILKNEMDINTFRAALKENFLKPESFGLDPASLPYEQLLDRYSFDGFSLGKIQNWIEANAATRVSQRFEPKPEEVFVRYKFNKKSKVPYKVDSESGTLETDGPFTELGQAVDRALHAESDVTFEEGDTVLVDQLTAEGTRGQEQTVPFNKKEDVTEVDRIYVRQLRDFPYLFSDLSTQTAKFVEEAARVRATIVVQEKLLADALAQQDDRENTKRGLDEDNGNLKNDWESIQALHDRRAEDVRNLQAQISTLKNQIQANYNRIQELTLNIERQVYAGN